MSFPHLNTPLRAYFGCPMEARGNNETIVNAQSHDFPKYRLPFLGIQEGFLINVKPCQK